MALGPIEKKVPAGGAGALVGMLLGLLVHKVLDVEIEEEVLMMVGGVIVALVGGWLAPHTPRPDLEPAPPVLAGEPPAPIPPP